MRRRTGSVMKRRGSWWARVIYADPRTGKRRDVQRKGRSQSEARDLRDRLLREIDETDGWALTYEKATVKDLCDFFLERYAVPPQYVDGRKVAGMRSYD